MRRTAVFGLAFFLVAGSASAERASRAYVDSVSTYGGPAPVEASAFVRAVVEQAGYAPILSADDEPCGMTPGCHVERGRKALAAISLQATVIEVAGTVSVSFYVVDVQTGAVSQSRQDEIDLSSPRASLATALPSPVNEHSSSGRRIAAWSLTGAGVALAVGGSLAWLHSRSLRSEFLDNHVDENGDVFGISPAAARQKEQSAKRWELAGVLLWTAAAGSGVTATILFSGDHESQAPRPAGVVLVGEF